MLIFFSCTLDKVHVSLSYNRVLHTQKQKTLDFMQILNFRVSQILAVSRAKVPEALPMRQLIYVSNDASDAILEPKYTFSISLPSILICGGISVSWLRFLVF